MKAEDGAGLNRFYLFLTRCKSAMEGSVHLSRLEQPDVIRRLVLKPPFSMRIGWCRAVDAIMEEEGR